MKRPWCLLAASLVPLCATQECTFGDTCSADECSLYMAESTIPNAGIGVFTTKELFEGDLVQPAGEVQIPIFERRWHMGNNRTYFWPLRDYVWKGRVMGMQQEVDFGAHCEAYCPGYDSTANSHLGMISLQDTTPQYDSGAGLHRSRDVGAGAITPYLNGTHRVTAHVVAGGELFKNYGSDWFRRRRIDFGDIPLEDDHETAEELVQTFVGLGLSPNIQQAFWDDVVRHNVSLFPIRTMNALPKGEDLNLVADEGIRAIYTRHAVRDVEFLRAHGRCLDNMLPGPSTIHQAGRGAFATRPLPKDSIITGSPLAVVLERQYLYMYASKLDRRKKEVRDETRQVGYQLLLNYCFGHPQSEVLLCPYGTFINYINHNQTQANVKIQWSENGLLGHNDSYLQLDPIELKDKKTVLAFDYVALRDIEPGEELFLDYGDDFEEAWNKHVENWRPQMPRHYADAATFNTATKNIVLRTPDEELIDPYPSNLEMHCHEQLIRKKWKKVLEHSPEWHIDGKGFPCQVMSRSENEEGDFVYDVQIEYFNDDNEEVTLEREGVPRSVIAFVDRPYTTDIHLWQAFRHEIGIPDKIFPKKWKNRVEKK